MTELKQCTKCKEEFPSTEEYFYKQLYYTKNKEKYYKLSTQCKSCLKERANEYASNHKEQRKRTRKNYYERNKDKEKRMHKEYRENNQKSVYKIRKEWRENNKDKLKRYQEERKHKNHIISKSEWESCKNYFDNCCSYCGLHISEHFNQWRGEMKWTDFHKEHVDHLGSVYLDNCVPSCKSCNCMKHDFEFEEWYNLNNPNYSTERYEKIIKWITEDYLAMKGTELKITNDNKIK